jgi:hypothetical protein
MPALKVLLTIAGWTMLAAALGVPIYGMWMRYGAARRWEADAVKRSF